MIGHYYYRQFRQALPHYHPNPIPMPLIDVGDYGRIENGLFVKKGNIRETFNIEYTKTKESFNRKIHFERSCSGSFKVNADCDVEKVCDFSASLGFEDKDAFYFHSVFDECEKVCRLDLIEDLLYKLFKEGTWKAKNVLVTETLRSHNTVLALSGDKKSSIVLRCQAEEYPQYAANAGFSNRNQTNSVLSCCTNGDDYLIPGFKLFQFKRWSKEFRCISYGVSNPSEWIEVDSDEFDDEFDYKLLEL